MCYYYVQLTISPTHAPAIALLEALSEQELDNPDLINGAAKERVALATGKSGGIICCGMVVIFKSHMHCI